MIIKGLLNYLNLSQNFNVARLGIKHWSPAYAVRVFTKWPYFFRKMLRNFRATIRFSGKTQIGFVQLSFFSTKSSLFRQIDVIQISTLRYINRNWSLSVIELVPLRCCLIRTHRLIGSFNFFLTFYTSKHFCQIFLPLELM